MGEKKKDVPPKLCWIIPPHSPPQRPALLSHQASGTLYYEVEILTVDDGGICQLGFAGANFEHFVRSSNRGVGDDDTSWAVDGMRQLLWHKGHKSHSSSWGGAWRPGDIIGVAVDLERGVMSVSVNGSFDHPNGTAFDCVRPGPTVGADIYPALSANRMKVAVNLGLDPERLLRFAPQWGRRDNLQVRFIPFA
jgi:hypothetical protein